MRVEHGKARPALPRAKDLAHVPPVGERHRQRDTNGRFIGGNTAGCGRGWRVAIAKMVGRDLRGEVAPLAREAWRVFQALLKELPHTGAQVSCLVAARARSAVLSARFAVRAAELGLDTDAGRSALELSMKLDARAERLAVTSLDIATRLAASERKTSAANAHTRVFDRFGAPTAGETEEGAQ